MYCDLWRKSRYFKLRAAALKCAAMALIFKQTFITEVPWIAQFQSAQFLVNTFFLAKGFSDLALFLKQNN